MARLSKKKTAALVCLLFIFLLVWTILSTFQSGVGKVKRLDVRDFVSSTIDRHKEFLYLVQTESCLPIYLAQQDLLGNSSSCRCDLLVLSFKAECKQHVTANHIQYVYGPNTTWASGRNTLYRIARKRNVNYRYYVFADDDLRLQYNPYVNASVTQQPELRSFENFLLEIEPAVGCANYVTHHPATFIRTIRQNCLNKPDLSLLPMVHFDPILNAFHRDAYHHLLPYPEDYDRECWWHSHGLISIAIDIKFRGQAVMYPGITALNTIHRSYPVNATNEEHIFKNALAKHISKLPERFRDHFAVKSYKENMLQYRMGYCHTTCMDVKAHQAIIPYAHFEELPLHGYKSFADVFNETTLGKDLKELQKRYYSLHY